jgi:hypothetical protein
MRQTERINLITDIRRRVADLGLSLRIDRLTGGAIRWTFFDEDSRHVADWRPDTGILAVGDGAIRAASPDAALNALADFLRRQRGTAEG